MNESITYTLPAQKVRAPVIYLLILLIAIAAISTLPFISTTISTRAIGITRPVNERTEIRPMLTGVVDKIFYNEGSKIKQGDTIATIRNDQLPVQTVSNTYGINQRQQFIHDLKILTSPLFKEQLLRFPSPLREGGRRPDEVLSSPLYQQQLNRFQYQLADQQASLKKVQKELDINNILIKDKVIAPKEAFDKQVENEKAQAAYKAFTRNQIAQWQQELATYQAELSQLQATRGQINADKKNFLIKAPVSGVLQGINNLYEGSVVQAGQAIATVSPDNSVIAECYVNTRDVGLLKTGQPVRFQIDAFDYNYFGILTGKIISIGNDFTMMENQPVFKVRCEFDSTQLRLKNGFTGKLKKGLTLQARFVIGERTLWQLLFDKIDDWLNPAAPMATTDK